MNITVIFLSYVFAGFVGFSAVALVTLLLKHKDVGKSQLMKAMCGFIVSSFLLGVIYFVTDFLDTVYGGHPYNAVIRIADMWLFILLGYFWLQTVKGSTLQEKGKFHKYEKIVLISIVMLMILAVPEYIFFMDPYYYVNVGWERIYSYTEEILTCIVFVIFDFIYFIKSLKMLKLKETKVYILITTSAVIINSLWNGVATLWVINGKLTIATWNTQVNDPTALLLLIINLSTLIYVFRNDFSPIYFHVQEESKELDDEEKIGFLAEQYKLTAREKEVASLAYQGYSYEEMADELIISKYTVKRHMHNMYEKFEISTRMDLVNLVKGANGL